MFKLNDRVIIGGRTMLSPGFSLVGLTGRVVSSRADAPPGTVAVWVDWEEGGYTETEELPSVVNVPALHLEPVDQTPDKPASPLTCVPGNRPTPSIPNTTASPAAKTESERPRENPFRLVD